MKQIPLEKLADILDRNRNKPISDSHWKEIENDIAKLGKKYTEDAKRIIPTSEIINSQFNI